MDFSLARELEAREVSQSELARASGVPQPTISEIARGISPGRPTTRRKLRAALAKYPLRYRGTPLEAKPELVTPGSSPVARGKGLGLAEPWSVLPPIEQEPFTYRERSIRVVRNPDPGSGSGIPVQRNPAKRRTASAEPVTRAAPRPRSAPLAPRSPGIPVVRNPDPGSGSGIPVQRNPAKRRTAPPPAPRSPGERTR